MMRVLEDAFHVMAAHPRSRGAREARLWMASADMDWPFSFERICETLDLDPVALRRQAREAHGRARPIAVGE